MEYKIGTLTLGSRVFLAPMLEPNDIAFRLLCKRAGCGLTYTGMTSALSRKKLDLDDKPMLQLFGNSVRGIRSFMEKYDSQVSGWDFNLGCPSKLSKKLEHGAFMASDFEMIREILGVMRGCTKKVLTVKIRKSDSAFEVLKICEEVGVDAICVHARTVEQGYSGEVDYEFALAIKRRSGIPVIFSGVSDLDDTDRMLEDFDFVMIGREAIGRPGVFALVNEEGNKNGTQMNADERRFGFGEYLKLARKYGLFFRQIKYQAMNFTKGIVGGKSLRVALIEAREIGDVERIMGKNI